MFLVVPLIKFSNACVTEAIIGKENMKDYYEQLKTDPVRLIQLLRRENSKSVAVVDNDKFAGIDNTANIDKIIEMSNNIDIPIQLISIIDTVKQARDLLERGIYRIFVDTLLFTDIKGLEALIKEFSSSNICLFVSMQNGKLKTDRINSDMDLLQYTDLAKSIGIDRILYADFDIIAKDENYDIPNLLEIVDSIKMRMTIYEGIKNQKTMWKYNDLPRKGIDSVILGKTIHENNFACQAIWREMESKLEPNKVGHTKFPKTLEIKK